MENRLETILERYENITKQLMDPEVMANFNEVKKLSKEQSDLKEIVEKYEEYKKTKENIEGAKILLVDPELKEMAEVEYQENSEKLIKINEELEYLLNKVEGIIQSKGMRNKKSIF